ncbi:hypothetical protein GGG16DRAFT_61431 [Schizophyllum commune]
MPRLLQIVLLAFRSFFQSLIASLDDPLDDPALAFPDFDLGTNPDSAFMNTNTQSQSTSGARSSPLPGQMPLASTQMHLGTASYGSEQFNMSDTGYSAQPSASDMSGADLGRGRQLPSTSASGPASYGQEGRFSPYPAMGPSSSRRRVIPTASPMPDAYMSGMGISQANDPTWNALDPSFVSSSSFESYTGFPIDTSTDLPTSALYPSSLDPASASTTSATDDPYPFGASYPTSFDAPYAASSSVAPFPISRPHIATDAMRRLSLERRTRPAEYGCNVCGATFTARHNLRNHLRSHEGRRDFVCAVCQATFINPGVRDRHQAKCTGA